MNHKKIRILLLVAIIGMLSNMVYASTFNFSYDFASNGGPRITGSFEGNQSGNLVNNISNITMAWNGVDFDGPLFSEGWFIDSTGGGSWVNGLGVASFDGSHNNFQFIDRNYPVTNNWTNYFADTVITGDRRVIAYDESVPVDIVYYDLSTYGVWRLQLDTSSVPEASSIYLLAFGLLGLYRVTKRKV